MAIVKLSRGPELFEVVKLFEAVGTNCKNYKLVRPKRRPSNCAFGEQLKL